MKIVWNAAFGARNGGASDVDVRGFRYALAPLQQREHWQLDKLLVELARSQRMLDEHESRLVQLEQAIAEQALVMQRSFQSRPDPQAHQRALACLTTLCREVHRFTADCVQVREERDRSRDACAAQQMRLQELARDGEGALQRHTAEVRSRTEKEQSREVLSRFVAARLRRGREQTE